MKLSDKQMHVIPAPRLRGGRLRRESSLGSVAVKYANAFLLCKNNKNAVIPAQAGIQW